MRNHVVFKFLAIVLCALCLMTALVSGGGLLVLMSMDLGENTSPYQGFCKAGRRTWNGMPRQLLAGTRQAMRQTPMKNFWTPIMAT